MRIEFDNSIFEKISSGFLFVIKKFEENFKWNFIISILPTTVNWLQSPNSTSKHRNKNFSFSFIFKYVFNLSHASGRASASSEAWYQPRIRISYLVETLRLIGLKTQTLITKVWWHLLNLDHRRKFLTSMLVTDIGDKMCWWQVWDVVDGASHFGHQHHSIIYHCFVPVWSSFYFQDGKVLEGVTVGCKPFEEKNLVLRFFAHLIQFFLLIPNTP